MIRWASILFFGFIIFNPNSTTTVVFKEKYGGFFEYNNVNKVEEKNNKYYIYSNDTLKACLSNEYSLTEIK